MVLILTGVDRVREEGLGHICGECIAGLLHSSCTALPTPAILSSGRALHQLGGARGWLDSLGSDTFNWVKQRSQTGTGDTCLWLLPSPGWS